MFIFCYFILFLFGIIIGSFLNVCIYRLPKHEDIVKTSSHCMTCGCKLKWYDLVPLFSFIALRGKCRNCHTKLSLQYPIIEAVNGVMYMLIFAVVKVDITTCMYMDHVREMIPLFDATLTCALFSVLLVIAVIDFRTYEIPLGCNIFIGIVGLLHMAYHYADWVDYLIGFFAVSVFLLIVYYATRGRGIGGGDIKLMAVAGLFLGWKSVLLAFLLGCVLGSLLHILRMKLTKADHVLAFGPYLAMGIGIAALWGNQILDWYLGLLL